MPSRVEAYDPAWNDNDRAVLRHIGIVVSDENLVGLFIIHLKDRSADVQKGSYALDPAKSWLLFLPHCGKSLYESLLFTNFSPRLAGRPSPRDIRQ